MIKYEMNIVTYNSANSPSGKEWLAFIVLNGDYLPVRFTGVSEADVIGLAQAEWDKHEAEREANLKRREEGLRKAAETRARKKAGE